MRASVSVTLYTQPGCGPCVAVKSALKRYGIDHTIINVREDEAAMSRLIELGYQGTPVTETADGEHWYGLNMDRIKNLAEVTIKVA
jgi:glutaredoxin